MRSARSITKSIKHIRAFADKAKGYKASQSKPTPASNATPSTPTPSAPPPPPPPRPPVQPPPSSSAALSNAAAPVDLRLLAGAGVAMFGAGALYYTLSSSSSSTDKGTKPDTDASGATATERIFTDEYKNDNDDDGSSSTSSDGGDSSEQQQLAAADQPSAAFSTPQQQQQEKETTTQQEDQHGDQEPPPTYVNSQDVLGVIQDVLTKDGNELLQRDQAIVSGTSTTTSTSNYSKDTKQDNKKKVVDVEVTDGAATAISLGIADTAAETVVSSIATSPSVVVPPTKQQQGRRGGVSTQEERKSQNQQQQPPSIGTEAATAAGNLAGIDTSVREILGLTQQDMTASGLIAAAFKRKSTTAGQHEKKDGQNDENDWESFSHRHRQAVHDSETIAQLLTLAASNVKKQLAEAKEATEAAQQEVARIRGAAAAQAERFQSALKDVITKAEETNAVKMKMQAQQLAVAHAEVTVRERVERVEKLDDVRLKLDAIEVALDRRTAESKAGHTVHQLSLGAFAMNDALDNGTDTSTAVQYLQQVAGTDTLVNAVLQTVPKESKISTRPQLEESFADVEKAVRELHALPAGEGGLLTVAVGKLSALLKIREKNPQQASNIDNGGGVDQQLASARSALTAGQLLTAAGVLESAAAGSAAEPAVEGWIKAVKERVAAEQAAAVLEARAATLAASLA